MDADSPIPELSEAVLPSRRRLAIAVVLLCALLFLTVGATTQLLNIPFGLWFTEIFVFLGTAWVMTRMSGRRPWVFARLGPLRPGPALFGLLLGVINYFTLVVPLESLALKFSPEFLKRIAPDSARIFLNQGPVELALLMLAVGLVAPICEEFAFRGVIQQGLFPGSRAGAIVVTAILFSAFHLDPVGCWARLELGILFGWLFLRTGSLWPGVCAHAANNLTASALYFLFKDVKPEAQDTPLSQILLLALVGSGFFAALFAAARKYPSLLKLEAPRGELVALREASLYRFAWPWILAATLALLGLFAVDTRGVQLNWMDFHYGEPKGGGENLRNLEELRRKARAGQVPMDVYEKRLQELRRGRSG